MMKIKILALLLILSVFFYSCENKKNNSEQNSDFTASVKIEADSNYILENVAKLETFDQIEQKYGRENVKKDTMLVSPEGKNISASILYPKTENELIVYWVDKKPYQKLSDVVVNCDSSGYKGKWQSILGIKPGQKLSEVVDINQKEFTISGFGWAYGGHVVSWEGGTLNNKNVTGSFADFGNGKISDDGYRNISGDTEFNVSLDAIKKLNPTLKQVIVYSKK